MKRNPWATLAALAVAQFVVVLDLTVVNVALPHIQTDLHFSGADSLQWVVNAYTLLFGGFLLLGGRAADLLGRRRLFIGGLALFTLASLVGGLAQSPTMLIAARAVQGFGGAMLSPAALSLVTVTFPHGRDRNTAMGIWGALGGLGGTLGVVLGGILVSAVGWRSVFFVNVPIGVALAVISPYVINESRAPRTGTKLNFDIAGALLGTFGLLALVFGVVRSQPLGWGAVEVVASLAAGVIALVAFVAVEMRTEEPLVPMTLFRSQGMRSSTVALALNGASFLTMFFLTALFLQQVRGQSALWTGLELLPMGVVAVIAAVVGSMVVTRTGTRGIQVIGSALSVVGLFLLSRAGIHSSYVGGLLPGFLLFGWGLVWIGVPAQIAAVAEVKSDVAGAAGAVVNAAYQVGGALGLAIITTLSNNHVASLAHHEAMRSALTGGFQLGLVAAAVAAALNLVVGLTSPRLRPDAEMLAAATAAA